MDNNRIVKLHRLSAETSSMLEYSYCWFERLEDKESNDKFQELLEEAICKILDMKAISKEMIKNWS